MMGGKLPSTGIDPSGPGGRRYGRGRRRGRLCRRQPPDAILNLDEIPLMTRGRGVILQRYKSGGLTDAKVFRLADGLSWRQGENRTRTETDLTPLLCPRVAASP